jgi:repressor LexA
MAGSDTDKAGPRGYGARIRRGQWAQPTECRVWARRCAGTACAQGDSQTIKRSTEPITESTLELRRRRQEAAKVRALLAQAVATLEAVLDDGITMEGTAVEAQTAMQVALEAIGEASRRLRSLLPADGPAVPLTPDGPTRQQGQFLAYILEYMLRNEGGVAPAHADLQWFFQLTPPSANSMLIRLEQRGFIRRVPHQARSIEIAIDPELIPLLERPFKARCGR